VVSVQINQIIFGQIIKPAQASGGSRFADGEQRTIFGVGQLHGTLLDQAREIVPQCRFWSFSLWIHGWTNNPCFARSMSANAKLGPQPVFVNGNHMAAEIFRQSWKIEDRTADDADDADTKKNNP